MIAAHRFLSVPALALAATACLLLGGCKKDASPSADAASGTPLLSRSVNDDMLPYDTVRSQSPLAAPTAENNFTPGTPRETASEAAAPEDIAADAAAAAAADVEAAAQPTPHP